MKKYDKSKAGTAFGSFLNDSKLDSYVARTGYDFAGWYTGEKNGEKIGSDTARPSEDTTYYARWQIRTVTIRLGGTVGKNYGYIGIYKGGSFSDNYGVLKVNDETGEVGANSGRDRFCC